jgi:beta-N-acetylhexosaminidase
MAQPLSAAVFDSAASTLSADEKAFFREVNPFGFILFARHCGDPDQVRRLVGELKSLSGRDRLPIFIDQEGGRVARLKPPHWAAYPPAAAFARLAGHHMEKAILAVRLNARLMAHDLYALGITVDCAPLADIPVAGAHDVIGDRAFGDEPGQVIALARAMADGLMQGGIVPVLKHIPGHGRAAVDSHEDVPLVDTPLAMLRVTDFVPFKALNDLPMGMTAHVTYTAIDKERMVTVSPAGITLIREELGFKNLLLSDALDMKSMNGMTLPERARAALDAGCDIALHCNAPLADKMEIAKGLRALEGESLARAEAAMRSVGAPQDFDAQETRAQRDALLAETA